MSEIIRIACPAPCPITGKPCDTGKGYPYYYPGDCPEWNECEQAAIMANPCPCGRMTDVDCAGECDYLRYEL